MAAQERIEKKGIGVLHFRTAWVRRGTAKGPHPRLSARKVLNSKCVIARPDTSLLSAADDRGGT